LLISDFGLKSFTFQSAIHDPHSAFLSSLSLFMLRVGADHAHHAFAVDDLAVITHLFD
jgi:hypothetical protein